MAHKALQSLSKRFLALNTVAMRNAELTSGIEVYSDEMAKCTDRHKLPLKKQSDLQSSRELL